jgi:hypothetical protein
MLRQLILGLIATSFLLIPFHEAEADDFYGEYYATDFEPLYLPPYYNLIGYSGGLYTRYVSGKGIGIHEQYGTLGVMVSPKFLNSCYRTFIDCKGHYIQDGKWAANLGIGVRWWDCCQKASWGASWYYDYRQINHDEHFDQVGFGFERLGSLLDVRMNAYFPVERSIHSRWCADDSSSSSCCSSSSSSSSSISSSPINLSRGCSNCSSSSSSSSFDSSDCYCIGFEESHSSVGFDGEIGIHLFQWNGFYGYTAVGGYYFHNHVRENQTGARVRALLSWADFITFEARFYQDRYTNSNLQGVVTLCIPLDPCAWEDRGFFGPPQPDWIMTQPIVRNDMIVLDRHRCWKY